MPINYYSVLNHLEENGWTLLSTEYKNLKTPLQMKCPEGHIVEVTYEEWRKRIACEKCIAGDPYKVKKNKVPKKQEGIKRILALDAATNISGYAIYDDKTLVSYGTYHTNETLKATERINQVKYWLEAAIKEWQPDFAIVEDIQLQSYGGSNKFQVETYKALAKLQGVVLDILLELSVRCSLVYSTVWREKCGIGGTGRENKKKAAQDKVKMWYNLQCTQDEADAICIGKYFTLTNNNGWSNEK